jgi:transcriptional regulator with XRE-family HTH domain
MDGEVGIAMQSQAGAARRSPNPEWIARRIGPRIRARRVELGMSVRELARRIDVSASFVSLVETGRCAPSVSTFRALASELDISAAELLADPARGLFDRDRLRRRSESAAEVEQN